MDSEGLLGRGLKNLGNSCFLNSVLQAISSCPPFIEYLDNDFCKTDKFSRSLRECITELRVKPGKKVGGSFNSNPLDVTNIYDMIIAFNPSFSYNEQQDAQELLQTVFAMLDRANKKRKPNVGLKGILFQEKDSLCYRRPNPFHGSTASKTICVDCKTTRPVRYTSFTDLSLPFVKQTSIKRSVLESNSLNGGIGPGFRNNQQKGLFEVERSVEDCLRGKG